MASPLSTQLHEEETAAAASLGMMGTNTTAAAARKAARAAARRGGAGRLRSRVPRGGAREAVVLAMMVCALGVGATIQEGIT